jgi:colanic acid/amylovoran biosynthesis glycosyltransferase
MEFLLKFMKTIAYLINQYPKVSHSFIRREIAAVAANGMQIERFSIRSCENELVDPADRLELERTRILLKAGIQQLFFGLLRTVVTKPIGFCKALGWALKLSRSSERGILYHLAYLVEAAVLLGWFSEANVEHVHAHFGTNSTTVALLCQVMGGPPYSFTVHGPEEFDQVMAIALPEKIKQAAFVVAISSFGRSQLYRWCSQEQWSKIHVVHCGVNHEFLTQAENIPSTEARLVCVGRLCEQKGQLLLLDAVNQLVNRGLKFKLVLVGDGELRPELEAAIDRMGLHDSVEILGWASSLEVRRQILAARALVLPSFAEGLPVVIMEALALGRPVISTYVAGIPELVEDKVCGWLVSPGSVEALVEAMQTALKTPLATLDEMGQAGIQCVAEQHNVVTEAGKLAALFQNRSQIQKGQLPENVLCTDSHISGEIDASR